MLSFVPEVVIEPTFEAWRDQSRSLLAQGVSPDAVKIIDPLTQPGLAFSRVEAVEADRSISVPRDFVERAAIVACHRNPERWQLLYRLLWRLQSERNLLKVDIDEDVAIFRRLEHQVRRDLHKMHAFLRFRRVDFERDELYVAWYEPDHYILNLAVPFFRERFAVMRWSILTPDASVSWDPDAKRIQFGLGVSREAAPQEDELEGVWRTYYGSIFNPARLNTRAMRNEMPVRYWKNLPELNVLPQLLEKAGDRVDAMIDARGKLSAASYVPQNHELPILRESIPQCRGCDLHSGATQAVFGQGPQNARLMLIGEQPGDEEDRSGQPFVGPAGRLLNEVLREVGIDREQVYVTNAVKHFKYVQRGKLRLHQSPRMSEIVACRPWLLAELDAVRPELVVCLGASAAKSLLGAQFALMREHGRILSSVYAPQIMATLHPSAILRAIDATRGAEMRAMMTEDLKLAAARMEWPAAAGLKSETA